MRCRRQAPTGQQANPTLVGGSDDEAASTNWCRARAPSVVEARVLGWAMIDVNNSDDSERAADPMASSPPTEVSHTQTAGLTESELPELVGCQPDFPPAPKPNSSA